LCDQAVLQIVDVTLRDLCYVVFAFAYYTVGLWEWLPRCVIAYFAISISKSHLSKLSIYECIIH